VRVARFVAENARREARRDDNPAMCVMACLIACILRWIEDIMEWFNSFAFVQVAVRGLSYCDACRATRALAHRANFGAIRSQILAFMVTNTGALVCGLVGTASSVYYCYMHYPEETFEDSEYSGTALAFGFVFGFGAAMAVAQIFDAGVTTILVCWCEDSAMIAEAHPDMHAKFCSLTGRAPPVGGRQYFGYA